MTTQRIEISGVHGEIGVEIHVFSHADDSPVDSGAASAAVNRLGVYYRDFTDLPAGSKRIELRASDGSQLADGYCDTTADDGEVFVASDSPPTVIAYSVLAKTVQGLVEDNCSEHSLGTLILAMLESARSGTTWTIRKVSGSTKVTKTIAVDAAADPVVSVS